MDGLMMRRHALLARSLGTPLTVSGPTPLLMPRAVAKPMRKATFAIEAVQAGTGDPSPSNVRPISGHQNMTAWVTGKVLAGINGVIATGSTYSTGFRDTDSGKELVKIVLSLPAGNYNFGYRVANIGPDNTRTLRIIFDDNTIVDFMTNWSVSDAGWATNTVTIPPGLKEKTVNYVYAYFGKVGGGDPTNASFSDLKITAADVTPLETDEYSGSTVSVEFPAMGANLIPETGPGWYSPYGRISSVISDGVWTITNTHSSGRTARLDLGTLEAGTYYFSFQAASEVTALPMKNKATEVNVANCAVGSTTTFTLTDPVEVMLMINTISGENTISKIMLSKTNVPYEPFTNTVYSGTVDPVTGEGVVTHKCVTIDTNDLKYNNYGFYNFQYATPGYKTQTAAICDKLIYANVVNGTTVGNKFSINGDYLRISVDGVSKESDHKEDYILALGDSIQVLYELADPIPFSVTPQSLTPPAGDAYIWADCGGSAEVTYMGKA